MLNYFRFHIVLTILVSTPFHSFVISDKCLIYATCKTSENLNFNITVDCNKNASNFKNSGTRFANIEEIIWNGEFSNKEDTLCIEYIPHPEALKFILFEGFFLKESATVSLLKNLTDVVMKDNVIPVLDNSSFSGLESLRTLELHNNKIKIIMKDSLKNLSKLELLFIDDPKLDLSQIDLEHNTNLKSLDLRISKMSRNFLENLPNSIQSITLRNVYIENQKVVMPTQSYSFLEDFKVSEMNLTQLKLDESSVLKYLDASHNILNDQSFVFGKQHQLMEINLSFNELTDLNCIDYLLMPKLKQIEISHNRIQFVYLHNPFPESLSEINLKYNLLNRLDVNVKQLHSLKYKLDISNNPWDCSYLNKRPEIFRIFKYNMNTITSNVKGLACLTLKDLEDERRATAGKDYIDQKPKFLFHSDEKKITERTRNPTTIFKFLLAAFAAAVISSQVFLFLYQKYKRIHREPFYRSLAHSLPRGSNTGCENTDSILLRKLPPLEYEVPISCVFDSTTNDLDESHTNNNNIYEEIKIKVIPNDS